MASEVQQPSTCMFDDGLYDDYGDDSSGAAIDASLAYISISSETEGNGTFTLSNFGFTIPAGATVTGFAIRMRSKASVATETDYCIQYAGVRKSGGGSTLYPSPSELGTSLADATVGGSTAMFGNTWTPAEVNNTSVLTVSWDTELYRDAEAEVISYLDGVELTVYYTEGGNALRVSRVPLNSFVQGALVP